MGRRRTRTATMATCSALHSPWPPARRGPPPATVRRGAAASALPPRPRRSISARAGPPPWRAPSVTLPATSCHDALPSTASRAAFLARNAGLLVTSQRRTTPSAYTSRCGFSSPVAARYRGSAYARSAAPGEDGRIARALCFDPLLKLLMRLPLAYILLLLVPDACIDLRYLIHCLGSLLRL